MSDMPDIPDSLKDPKTVTLFQRNDMKIEAYVYLRKITVHVNRYCTLKGFHGDEDYYEHYIKIDEEHQEKFKDLLKQETKKEDLLDGMYKKFKGDNADLKLIKFCKTHDIPFYYFNVIDGIVESENKEKIGAQIKELKDLLKRTRKHGYYVAW